MADDCSDIFDDLPEAELRAIRASLIRKIGQGTAQVTTSDGKSVTYRTTAEIKEAIRFFNALIAGCSNADSGVVSVSYNKLLGDGPC